MDNSDEQKHHYVPEFYLKRWAKENEIWRFSRPYGSEVKAHKVVPKGTAFEINLYKVQGAPPEKAQAMESDFLKKVDAQAAEALVQLENGLDENKWTSESRSAWSRFLLTQMLRAPEDIAQLKSSVAEDWSKAIPELEEAYAKIKSNGGPTTVSEYLQSLGEGQIDAFALRIAQSLMNHKNFGQALNDMHWLVLNVPEDCFPLLTSDRPVWMTATLTEPNAFITIPIGPRRLFIASVSRETQHRIKMNRRAELVKNRNRITVQHAVKWVFGDTNAMLPFIQKHMSTKRHSTLLERLAAMRGHKIVAPDAPLKNG
jgi:hypothetical protein